jgi:[ribosomal protein S5]-alanine N-acetyltransferase
MGGAPLPYPGDRLSNGRIGVRPWSEGDLECVQEAGADHDILSGTTVPEVFTPEEGVAFIHRQWKRAIDGEGVSQAIVDTTTDRALGLVIVSIRPQPQVAGLGYWVRPSARGRGAATEAIRLITPWAFEALGLKRLEAWVEPDNRASQQVLLNAGFQREGRLRNFLTTARGTSDALVFSTVSTP